MTVPREDEPRDADVPPPAPRWVKLFGLATVVVIVVFALIHLAGRGFHGH